MGLLKKETEVVKTVAKEKVTNTPDAKEAKKAAPKKGSRAPGKSLFGWLIIPTLLPIVFALITLVGLEMLFVKPNESQQTAQSKSIIANTIKQRINTYLKDQSTRAQALAKELAALSPSEHTDAISLVTATQKDLVNLYIIRSDQILSINETYPELSFASADTVRKGLAGEKTPVEGFFHNKKWMYQIAVNLPVPEGAPTKVLLALFNLDGIRPLLALGPNMPAGEVSLIKKNSTQTIIKKGTGDAANAEILDTMISQWQVRFSPDPLSTNGIDRIPIIIVAGTSGLILALLIYFISRSQLTILRNDLMLATKMLKASIMSEGKAPKGIAFAEVMSMVSLLNQNIKDLKQRQAQQTKQAKQQKPAAQTEEKTTEGDDPLFDDDLLDLDVLADSTTEQDPLQKNINGDDEPDMVQELAQLNIDVPQSIFRAYDIRGIVDETLNEGIVELIGRALASEAIALGQTKLCVGYDGRLSSVPYCEAITRGIVSTGVDAVIIGQIPTPVLYFATHHLQTGSGVMITGSHNPGNYNGFKMMLAGNTLSGDDIQKLYNRIMMQDFAEGQGTRTEESVDRDYLDYILNDIAVAAPLRVVVDAGNGVAGDLAPTLIEELGCEVIPLFCEVDGTFPNHHPDPGKPENLRDLIAAVKEHDADIGLAFDGDGDRVGVVTNTGKIIWPDRLLMLFAKDVVSRNPGADIIFDVKCSRRLNGLISGYGGRPIMWKTGHSLIKAKMKETGALLAGEMSGHIFFKERWFGFDDGLYSAVRLLEILGIEDQTSEDVFAAFPEDVSTPEINIAVTDESKFDLVEKLCAQKDQFVGGNVSTIDGLRVDYPNGWGLCRASNTTPVLVLRFEADDEAALNEIKDNFKTQLAAIDSSLALNF